MRLQGDEDKISIKSYTCGSTIDECEKNIALIQNHIVQTKSRKTELYCVLGLELAARKYMCFKIKCVACSADDNMYKVFECNVCNKKKENSAVEFFARYMEELECKHDWINFIIKLGWLCREYPMFKYSSTPLDKVKLYMKVLCKRMVKDNEFWQLPSNIDCD